MSHARMSRNALEALDLVCTELRAAVKARGARRVIVEVYSDGRVDAFMEAPTVGITIWSCHADVHEDGDPTHRPSRAFEDV